MKQPILKIGFTKFSDAEIDDKADTIIERMTNNPLYPNPNPSMADVIMARDAFRQVKTQKGIMPNYSAVKKVRRIELDNKLKELGAYVRDLYPGNVINWLTTGYDVQTFEGSTHIPPMPENVRIKDGLYPGTMQLRYKESKDAKWYEGQLLINGEVVPMPAPITSSKLYLNFTGLTKGTEYGFSVRAHGSKGVSPWSAPIYRVAQ